MEEGLGGGLFGAIRVCLRPRCFVEGERGYCRTVLSMGHMVGGSGAAVGQRVQEERPAVVLLRITFFFSCFFQINH
jgi:hypothetical protein